MIKATATHDLKQIAGKDELATPKFALAIENVDFDTAEIKGRLIWCDEYMPEVCLSDTLVFVPTSRGNEWQFTAESGRQGLPGSTITLKIDQGISNFNVVPAQLLRTPTGCGRN